MCENHGEDDLADLKEKTMKVSEAIEWAKSRLTEAGLTDPAPDVEYLITSLLGVRRHELYLDPDRNLTPAETARFREYVARRAAREPAQYITGHVEFYGREFRVTPATLIPRPETELLAEEGLKVLPPSGTGVAIDLCTGSGCVAVTIAAESPGCAVYATDISTDAIAVARENARSLGVEERVRFLAGDLFAPLDEINEQDDKIEAGLIVTNPPYVSSGDLAGCEPEVRDFEPRGALDGGPDGLDIIRRIITDAPRYLRPGGVLLMEIGYDQAGRVRELAAASGRWKPVELIKDFSGIERIVRLELEGGE